MTELSPPPRGDTIDAQAAIEPLSIDDLSDVRATHHAAIASSSGPFLTDHELAAYRATINSSAYADALATAIYEQRLYGAKADGFIIGTCGWRHAAHVAATAQLGWLFVHPVFSDAGFGRRLLSDTELKAIQAGCHRMSAQVPLAALRFFERLGYVVSSQGTQPVDGGLSIPVAHVRKSLVHAGAKNLTRH
ncbi:MAG: GNAT family N-acetyltransferase [Pseudomonadota bacterium]